MQLIAIMASRPTLIASQPNANPNKAASGKPNVPDPMNTMR
jgi:hypothetical protein